MSDTLFNFYKNNISKYYSTNVLLKIINDGTANIPPTMKEIFIKYYKKDYIKNGDDENYERYLRFTRQILDKLFKATEDSELLKHLKHMIDNPGLPGTPGNDPQPRNPPPRNDTPSGTLPGNDASPGNDAQPRGNLHYAQELENQYKDEEDLKGSGLTFDRPGNK